MHTYVDHAHVAWAFVAAGLGVVGFVLGIIRKVIVITVLALAVVIAGVAVGVVSLHGTHCGPGSAARVCLTIH